MNIYLVKFDKNTNEGHRQGDKRPFQFTESDTFDLGFNPSFIVLFDQVWTQDFKSDTVQTEIPDIILQKIIRTTPVDTTVVSGKELNLWSKLY